MSETAWETWVDSAAGKWGDSLVQKCRHLRFAHAKGRVKQVLGTLLEAELPASKIGDLGEITVTNGSQSLTIICEVVGFTADATLLSALNPPEGVAYGTEILALGCKHQISLASKLTGRVFDGMGRELGGGDGIFCRNGADMGKTTPVLADAVPATEKPRIEEPLITQIKPIDTMLTIGKGQRIGLFAGAGCGKTTLMASLARGCTADTIIIALIGERGRELKEFIDHELDEELRERTILVCATSDRSSMERSRAAFTATAIAEGLRDQGQDVLLLVDSLTRFARAQREIGLAAGEPPAKGGFPPSVYTMLPRLIERAGKTYKGSITAIYTLLMEGDSMADPIADEAKSLLDGHIVLSRKFAERGHYPAIDVLMSLSRTMGNVVPDEHTALSKHVRGILATYKELELLIKLGEYTEGNDPEADNAVRRHGAIMKFFQQGTHEKFPPEKSLAQLEQVGRG